MERILGEALQVVALHVAEELASSAVPSCPLRPPPHRAEGDQRLRASLLQECRRLFGFDQVCLAVERGHCLGCAQTAPRRWDGARSPQ